MDTYMRPCIVCSLKATFMCSGCHKIAYCGTVCQRRHWNSCHRRECGHCVVSDVCVGSSVDIGAWVDIMEHACSIKLTKRLPSGEKVISSDITTEIAGLGKGVLLGEGTFGFVMEYTTPSGTIAVKFATVDSERSIQRTSLCDIDIRNLEHPNVLGTCMVGFTKDPREPSPEKAKDVFAIVMDKASVDTEKYQKMTATSVGSKLTEGEMALSIYQMGLGVAYAHENLIVHGDIKLENFLVGGTRISDNKTGKHLFDIDQLMLTDFGLSARWYSSLTLGHKGTPYYMSPDLLLDGRTTMASDMWALGMTMYSFITGVSFQYDMPGEFTMENFLLAIFDTFGVPSKSYWPQARDTALWKSAHTDIKNLVAKGDGYDILEMLMYQYDRITPLIRKMLEMNPEKRMTSYEFINDPYFTKIKHTISPNMPPITTKKFMEMLFPGSTHIKKIEFRSYDMIEPKWLLSAFDGMYKPLESAVRRGIRENTWTGSKATDMVRLEHEEYKKQMIGIVSYMSTLNDEKILESTFRAFNILNAFRSSKMLYGMHNTKLVPFVCSVIAMKSVIMHPTMSDRLYIQASEIMIPQSDLLKKTPSEQSEIIRKTTKMRKDLPTIERTVLKEIDYDISRPNVYHYLEQLLALNSTLMVTSTIGEALAIALVTSFDVDIVDTITPMKHAIGTMMAVLPSTKEKVSLPDVFTEKMAEDLKEIVQKSFKKMISEVGWKDIIKRGKFFDKIKGYIP